MLSTSVFQTIEVSVADFSAEEVIKTLRIAGSSMSRPHAFDFYLYFSTKTVADDAAEDLTRSGFWCEVRPPVPGYSTWLCLARRELVPTKEALTAVGVQLSRVVEKFGGEFDGWEAAIARH